jgi:predicted permease
MEIFTTVLNTTAIMMALMAVGYFLGRRKLISDKAGRDLGILEVKLFLPAYLFGMLAGNVVPEKISVNIKFLLFGILFLASLILFSYIISRIYPGSRLAKLMFFYIMLYPNFGYFGYPVIEAAFGKEVLSQYIIFVLPLTFAVNTHGAYVLTTSRSQADGEKKKFNISSLKTIPYEVIIGVVLGTALGLLGVKLPAVVSGFFSFTGACMSPVSMLLAGLILSRLPLAELFRSAQSYIVNAVKLVGMPLVTCLILYFAGVRGYLLAFPTIFNALPVGMNVVIFAKPEQPDYVDTGVTCFISYILALLTVPLTFGLLSILL